LIPGLVVVIASMIFLFTVPREYFAAATFVSTGCMIVVAFLLGAIGTGTRLRYASLVLGLASAAVLYFVFYLGGAAVDSLHPFGVTSASEGSIYSLIASPSNPLLVQVALLFCDSAGYEAFFRGVLQNRLQAGIGLAAVPAVALLDAGIHLFTLNPIWVGGTFITDVVWGLTCYYGKGTQASFTSHFVWDLAIFIVRPIT
jgi:membrane protease YdiL (CAAX protease family)